MAEPLKNMYSEASKKDLAARVKKEYPAFDTSSFLKCLSGRKWKDAELKTRVRMIARALGDHLPGDFKNALAILSPVSDTYTPGYLPIFFPDFVELYGAAHWKESMIALAHFTKTSSAEFAIRPYIEKDPARAMKQMMQWAQHPDPHVRRLASEGCRPRLPWGMALGGFKKDPSPVLAVLEQLKNDPSLYVRKSVANNLNDISKDHPDLVLDVARRWIGQSERTDWIVKHALRGLLKKGNIEALKLFGFGHEINARVTGLKTDRPAVRIGEKLGFSFLVHLEEQLPGKLRIEYAVDYLRPGQRQSRKIFQVIEKVFVPGAHQISRTQRFQNFTTRKHHPGKHSLSILVNGKEKQRVDFRLLPEEPH